MKVLSIKSHGIPFNVVLDCEQDEPRVHFYDARYDFTEYGQFTGGGYYVSTLMERPKNAMFGLCLHGGVPEWNICAAEMRKVMRWLEENLQAA